MKVGLFLTFRNPPKFHRPYAVLYEELLRVVELTEELGFDGIWLGEHHFTDEGFAPSLMTLGAAIAARTKRITIGTYVLLLPQHNPVRLAEQAATVDILSNGRLYLCLGTGYRPVEYEAMGVPFRSRGSLMDESLEIFLRSLENGAFSFAGKHFHLENVDVTPKPVQRPRLRVLLGGSSEAMLRRAARFGCDGLAIHPPPPRYIELLQEYGRDPLKQHYVAMALGFVGETDDEAWETAREHAHWERDRYNEWWASAGVPMLFPNGPREDFIIGTPDRWIAAVKDMASVSESPIEHLVVNLTIAGMPYEDITRSVHLFAREVLPALHDI